MPETRVERSPAAATPRYILPFLLLLAFLAVRSMWAIPPMADLVIRDLAVGGVLLGYSRPLIRLRPRAAAASVLVGALVFGIWIAPDLLFPHYRQHWIFRNTLTAVSRGIPENLLHNPEALFLRTIRAVLIVPIAEELFWRAWLMRWLISHRFEELPLGAWSPRAFWITAVLFASEHGAYWDVGLATGIVYNWWIIRTRSLADCILAHAVTNGLLCAWVIETHAWQYWM